MKVSVYRYEKEMIPDGRFDEFEVPVPEEGDSWTVMDVLDYISLHQDPSIAYYKHSACNHGICGRCLLQVNGNSRLACLEVVDPQKELILKPAKNRLCVRDLITLDKNTKAQSCVNEKFNCGI